MANSVVAYLEIYDLDTGSRTVVKEYPYLIEAPNWTVDGQALIYNSGGRIYRLDLETLDDQVIPTGYADRCNNDHVLSADGKGLAISHQTAEDGHSRIYTLPLEGGIPRLITPLAPSYLHGWSPDGSMLTYCGAREGEYDIYTIPVEGGVEQQLTDAPGLNDGPEYDPTGEYIWFNSVRTGLMQVWRMRSDGSEQEQMTFDPDWNSWFPHVSPDGEYVVFLAYAKGDLEPHEHLPNKHVELRMMTMATREVVTLIRLFGGQGTINVNSWAPESRRFAFVSYEVVLG